MSRLYIARNKRVAARSLDGEMMIMSGKDSTLFTLNKTATIIWQAADGATSLDEIVERRICPEYDVEPTAALQDAETLARELASHGIVDVSEKPIVPEGGDVNLPGDRSGEHRSGEHCSGEQR